MILFTLFGNSSLLENSCLIPPFLSRMILIENGSYLDADLTSTIVVVVKIPPPSHQVAADVLPPQITLNSVQ